MLDGAPHEYKERPGACAECGNSPVNHFEHFVSNTLAVWTAEATLRKRGFYSLASRLTNRAFDTVEQSFLAFIGVMPFSRFSREMARATTYRSQVVWEEAERRGVDMEQLVLFGHPTEIYRARLNERWFYFQSLPIPPEKRGDGAAWLDDKYMLKEVLREAGIPVPVARSVCTEKEARAALEFISAPCVVKPRSGSRGRHTTVNVRAEDELREAFKGAKKLCKYVMVEQYIEGPVCRGTVVDGRLVGFFRADAPTVIGDGVATVHELVDDLNRERPDRVQPVEIGPEHDRFLQKMGFDQDSVPEKGARVSLTHRTGRLFGGRTRELFGEEHPKLRAHLEKAAAALGVAVVGFDLIIGDPEKDPDEQKWGIIEANSLPYIDLHYLALEGDPTNVAASVWDLWDGPIHTRGVDAAEASATMGA